MSGIQVFKKQQQRWKDGSVVKGTEFDSQNPHWVANNYGYNFKGSDTSGLPEHL